MSGEENPFAAPAPVAPGEQDGKKTWGIQLPEGMEVATSGQRLAGYLIDCLVAYGPVLVWVIAVADLADQAPEPTDEETVGFFLAVLVGVLVSFGQWVWISMSSQTLGKWLLGMRIVRYDGTDAGFEYGVVRRSWIFGIVYWIASICRLGWLLWFLDGLNLLFNSKRQTLHDRLAKTFVVKVPR